MLQRVRRLLHEGFEAAGPWPTSFGAPLSLEYPILALKQHAGFRVHGWADIRVERWKRHLDVETAQGFSVRSLSLQLFHGDSLLPVEMRLATFMHELAHTVTLPERRRAGSVPKDIRDLQMGLEGVAPEVP